MKLLNLSVPKTCCSLVLWFPDCKHISLQIPIPCVCSAHDLCFCELHKLPITQLLCCCWNTQHVLCRESSFVPLVSVWVEEGLTEERNIVREVNVLVLPQFCIALVTGSSLTLISALSVSLQLFPAHSSGTTYIPIFKCSLNRIAHEIHTGGVCGHRQISFHPLFQHLIDTGSSVTFQDHDSGCFIVILSNLWIIRH